MRLRLGEIKFKEKKKKILPLPPIKNINVKKLCSNSRAHCKKEKQYISHPLSIKKEKKRIPLPILIQNVPQLNIMNSATHLFFSFLF